MPDKLDGLLTDIAREAGGSVPVPSARAVRRRGAQRAARRRLSASVLALVLVGGAVGTAEAVIVPRGGTSAVTGGATPSAVRHSASPTVGAPSASASGASGPASTAPASGPPASVGAEPSLSALVGHWTLADGEARYLIIYSDGVLGIGQAGGLGRPLCAGRVYAPSNGMFPISVACSDYGTSGLSLSIDAGRLTLHVAATSGHPAETYAWVYVPIRGTAPGNGTTTLPPWLVGTWALDDNPAYETFTVAADGTVKWTLENQSGGSTHGTGTVEVLPGGGAFRVHTVTGSPGFDGFWEFSHDVFGELSVTGGYGPDDFHLVSGGT